ncbi:hypothetical protein C8Q69DRAFT_516927 [Paecilomyces variotii]|uniref:BTB domain-containing protein n=1 Tax=Byssochlamys spectabilis TaxID=264951 RepID=A0A443I1U5_BYSSP|nr:hypothetical protein C8Q69DRAFT_516927 [Paecilomyces variotii]RWQ98033.1 hypothetical protein C8Q69DRAFT_516927 [Paecilomyces variotii]
MSSEMAFEESMKKLLLHGDYSDMKVTCQGFTFNVHRAIVCSQSHFFASALNAGFEESMTRIVNLPDDDPGTIERVLSFLYLQKYNQNGHIVPMDDDAEPKKPETELSESDIENSVSEDYAGCSADVEDKRAIAYNNIRVYIAADKYGIAPLKSLAGKQFASWTSSNWNSEAFDDIVQEVMTYVPPHDLHLRDVVIETISKNIISLVKKGSIFQLMDTHGSLGSAVIAKLVQSDRVMATETEKHAVLDKFAQKLNGRRSCRHCGGAMNVRIEKGECLDGIIRCASCNTRH